VGELVDIGGAFRVPDIMRRVGQVSKSHDQSHHLRDYAEAINAKTGLLMTIPASNYAIQGLPASVRSSRSPAAPIRACYAIDPA